MSAQAEAYTRKKPRRIIQNQALIMLLGILAAISPIWLAFPIFYLIFAVCPSIAVPFVVILWVASVIVYIALDLAYRIKSEK